MNINKKTLAPLIAVCFSFMVGMLFGTLKNDLQIIFAQGNTGSIINQEEDETQTGESNSENEGSDYTSTENTEDAKNTANNENSENTDNTDGTENTGNTEGIENTGNTESGNVENNENVEEKPDIDIKVKYVFSTGEVYKEEIIKAKVNQILDSGDLPMIPDNMKFTDDFLFYQIKGDGADEVVRIIEHITPNEKPTENSEKQDKDTQTDLTLKEIEKLEETSKELENKISDLNRELKRKDRQSDRQDDIIKDLEDEIKKLEEELKKNKDEIGKNDEYKKDREKDDKLNKSIEELEKKIQELQEKLIENSKINSFIPYTPQNENYVPNNKVYDYTPENITIPENKVVTTYTPGQSANTSSSNKAENSNEKEEIRTPNKLTAKQPDNFTGDSDKDSNTNKGIATEPSKARADVVENKDNANNDYPIHHGNGNNGERDIYSADARQFITFMTKNGKTFHLIINHDEESENVMLLTEVSEDDLLNMVESNKDEKEVVKKIEKETTEEDEEIKDSEDKTKKEEEEKPKSKTGTYMFLGIVIFGIAGAGYYFKIYKNNVEGDLDGDFEEEYDELEDDYEIENDEYENNERIDDEEDIENLSENIIRENYEEED